MTENAELDLSAFENAISQLEQSLSYYNSKIVQQDPGLVLQLRAAAIQAFEFTYELSHKMIRRYLNLAHPNPDLVSTLSFSDMIRTACEYGLLQGDVAIWKEYRRQRSTTSHVYDQKKAADVFKMIPLFLKEAKYLLLQLKSHSQKL